MKNLTRLAGNIIDIIELLNSFDGNDWFFYLKLIIALISITLWFAEIMEDKFK